MRVSVVMIAVAKDFSASSLSPRPATTAGTAAISFSTGSGTPMIPVDDGMMNCGAASSAAPSAAQLCSATINSGSAGCAIRVARVDQHGAHAALVLSQVRPAHYHRRGNNPVTREHGRGTCTQRSLRQCNIAASACLDSGLGGRPEKSQGKKHRFVRSVQIHFSSFTSGCPMRSCNIAGRGRIANCGNSPQYIATSSHSCSLGQFAQSL